MYKDKDKQREAGAERQRRYKAKQKALLSEGVTDKALPDSEREFIEKVAEIYDVPTGLEPTLHLAIIATVNRLTTRPDGTIDQQARTNRMAIAENYQGLYPEQQYTGVGIASENMPVSPQPVRVSKPGDADCKPLCQTTREWMANR